MYRGISAKGINRELASTLECASLCREYSSKSLAIPETALLKLASRLPRKMIDQQSREGPLLHKPAMADTEFRSNWTEIARGILPSLRHVINRECETPDCDSAKRRKANSDDVEPDSFLDYAGTTVDPFGNDYYCKLCDHELSNTYYHCEGCETLLAKDFNICLQCFMQKKFLQNTKMHQGKKEAMHSNNHHVGEPVACKCHPAAADMCSYCKKSMTCCCCTCHTVFTKRFRFFTKSRLQEILQNVETVVGNNEIPYAKETVNRLNRVAMVPASGVGEQTPPSPHPRHGVSVLSSTESVVRDVEICIRSCGSRLGTQSKHF